MLLWRHNLCKKKKPLHFNRRFALVRFEIICLNKSKVYLTNLTLLCIGLMRMLVFFEFVFVFNIYFYYVNYSVFIYTWTDSGLFAKKILFHFHVDYIAIFDLK